MIPSKKLMSLAAVWIVIGGVDCSTNEHEREVQIPTTNFSSSGLTKVSTAGISDNTGNSESVLFQGRTFGKIKRMQMLIIPLAFKFGIMMTLIGVLVFLGLKSIILLKILLLVNFGGLLAKLLASKYEYKSHGPYSYGGHEPIPHNYGWTRPESKEVHVHIHNSDSGHKHSGWQGESSSYLVDPYSGHYSRNDINTVVPGQSHAPTIPQKSSTFLYRK